MLPLAPSFFGIAVWLLNAKNTIQNKEKTRSIMFKYRLTRTFTECHNVGSGRAMESAVLSFLSDNDPLLSRPTGEERGLVE